MYSIEFQTRIENGTIRVPKRYRQHLAEQLSDSTVRVIILVPGQQPVPDLIDALLADPIQVSDFAPLDRDEIHERD